MIGTRSGTSAASLDRSEAACRKLVSRAKARKVVATVSFAFDRSDRVTDIFIVRNPDKLAGLGDTSIH